MSTWTSSALALSILTALPGCLPNADVAMGAGGIGLSRAAPEKIAVANRSVIVAGPPGYCVDKAATKDTATGAFVLLGSCASIANSPRARSPATPALLTASVSPASRAAAASTNQLAAFFRSPPGRAALARNGRAGSVSILKVQSRDNALYIHARDSSANVAGNLAPDYWRGVFDLGGRLVTVSVIGFANRPLTDAASIATLDAFAARIRAENRAMIASNPNPRLPG
ncbi:MAG: hypothetical protein WBN04_03295 [Paracoccaceae bacterium]